MDCCFTFKIKRNGKIRFVECWRYSPAEAAQALRNENPNIEILGVADPSRPFPGKRQARYIPVEEAQRTWR